MKIKYIGHSCFKLECNGYEIVTDPYAPGSVPGLDAVEESADFVLCSHLHGDHGYREGVSIRNKADGAPAAITEIPAWHDEVKGAKRGPNTIHIMDFGGEKAAHLGDLGCSLEPDQIDKLKGLDVLLIPVGGFFTIDALQAAGIVKTLKPHIVIPMHYRDDEAGFGYPVIGEVKDFTDAMGSRFVKAGSRIDTAEYLSQEDKTQTQVILMRPQNCSGN